MYKTDAERQMSSICNFNIGLCNFYLKQFLYDKYLTKYEEIINSDSLQCDKLSSNGLVSAVTEHQHK
jgi:hypothetical protein